MRKYAIDPETSHRINIETRMKHVQNVHTFSRLMCVLDRRSSRRLLENFPKQVFKWNSVFPQLYSIHAIPLVKFAQNKVYDHHKQQKKARIIRVRDNFSDKLVCLEVLLHVNNCQEV
jgi:hypothetical protein